MPIDPVPRSGPGGDADLTIQPFTADHTPQPQDTTGSLGDLDFTMAPGRGAPARPARADADATIAPAADPDRTIAPVAAASDPDETVAPPSLDPDRTFAPPAAGGDDDRTIAPPSPSAATFEIGRAHV